MHEFEAASKTFPIGLLLLMRNPWAHAGALVLALIFLAALCLRRAARLAQSRRRLFGSWCLSRQQSKTTTSSAGSRSPPRSTPPSAVLGLASARHF